MEHFKASAVTMAPVPSEATGSVCIILYLTINILSYTLVYICVYIKVKDAIQNIPPFSFI